MRESGSNRTVSPFGRLPNPVERESAEQVALGRRSDRDGTNATGSPGETIERPLEDEPSLPPDACWDWSPLPDDAAFALCLTHDVDRPYKGIRSLYYGLAERSGYHLKTLVSGENPYWQFEEIADLEAELGVRSAFYFLNEQHLLSERPVRDWLSPTNWVQHLGRYDPASSDVAEAIRSLAEGGWEVGLHGSYHSALDRDRLAHEVDVLESILEEMDAEEATDAETDGHSADEGTGSRSADVDIDGRSVDEGIDGLSADIDSAVVGGRQHYLRCSIPETWRHHREIGLRYDASLGSGTRCGFHNGYRPIRPFGDDFRVFPLTIMEQALPDPDRKPEAARMTCEELLLEAAANEAVMTVLWHPRYFNEREFPGHRWLYRWLVERAQELGAWVGTPSALLSAFDEVDETEATPIDGGDPALVDNAIRGPKGREPRIGER
ncbi:polysaccharide deacetylase family protein [Halovivax gelatinilyticus]|uniref:polysaccharide deacetylase family protein n=1 Tax=Halovivax gelatinilyticus TaxID=2961597 RepID=UPI0020CA4499|nr:polysaccharide deacetylase family protein [Halovivax gelatinilyticus]